MLPKGQRLLLRHYQDFFSFASRYHTTHFVLYFLANKSTTVAKLAVIVPKKKHTSAVARNTAKRKTRAIIQLLAPKLLPGFYVVYQKKTITKQTTSLELQQELTQAFKKYTA